jgi:hypothetical protein
MTGKPHLAYWDSQWHVCRARHHAVGWPFESFARACEYAAVRYARNMATWGSTLATWDSTVGPAEHRPGWADVHHRGPRFRLPPDLPEPPELTPLGKMLMDAARTSGFVVRER